MGTVLDRDLKSLLRRQLHELVGFRFIAGDSRSDRIGTLRLASLAELRQVLTMTADSGVALIPRGATTNPFAGPEAAGLVLGFDGLAGIGRVNAHAGVVRVQPGALWHTLSEELAKSGFMPRMYPSSEGFSTVGGFVAQGGVGIGSYQFGEIGSNVSSVLVADATGNLHRLAGRDVRLATGAEGRTGLIVEVALRVQQHAIMVPVVATFDSLEAAEHGVDGVARQSLPLWSVHLLDPSGARIESLNWPSFALPEGKYAALFAFREADRAIVMDALDEAIHNAGGQLLAGRAADSANWLGLFATLTAEHTTPLPLQYRLPRGQLAGFMAAIPSSARNNLALEAVVANDGAWIAARLFFRGRTSLAENAPVARELLALARRFGGTIYATGALYLEEAEAVFGAERLADMAAFRQIVDPQNRLNPGRGFR